MNSQNPDTPSPKSEPPFYEFTIELDQVEDYARRKGWSVEQAKKWLAPLLG